jgi:Phosphotransferase enzyme family
MSVAYCIKQYSTLAKKDMLHSFREGSEESGVYGKTRTVENVPGLREKEYRPEESPAEAVATCIASEEDIAPLLHDAWLDSSGAAHLLLDDFELGTLEFCLRYRHLTARDYAELDAALVKLREDMRKSSVCHGDFHYGNLVVRRRGGVLQVKAIDYGRASWGGSCVDDDFKHLIEYLNCIKSKPLEKLPKLCALYDVYVAKLPRFTRHEPPLPGTTIVLS